ncbi:MAG: hypothetical protein ABSA30_12840, partial [Candidatus Aminicenantales bacterium]
MRSKKFIVSGLVAGFLFSLLAAPIFAGPGGLQAQDKQDKKEAKKAPVKVYIPKEVRDVMLAGLQTRQTRQDIPFTVFKSTFLPAQANYYIFLFLKMKNADLGYAAPPAQPAAKVAARLELFLQFHKMENGAPTQIVKEVYIPVRMELDAAGYDPAAEDWYTVGYPLPPADYLVAVALSTHDLKKIGTQYYEVSLPDVKAMKDLDTTPLVFLKDYKQVPQAETVAELHRGFMRYSVLQITPTD